MITKREYLVGLGLAKAGRGKFSNEAKNALAKAIAEGMEFSDSAPAVTKAKEEPTTPPIARAEDAVVVLDTERPYYGMRWYGKNEKGKRIEVSNRSACMNCGYSLLGHVCNSARVILPTGGELAVTASG